MEHTPPTMRRGWPRTAIVWLVLLPAAMSATAAGQDDPDSAALMTLVQRGLEARLAAITSLRGRFGMVVDSFPTFASAAQAQDADRAGNAGPAYVVQSIAYVTDFLRYRHEAAVRTEGTVDPDGYHHEWCLLDGQRTVLQTTSGTGIYVTRRGGSGARGKQLAWQPLGICWA